MTEDPRDRAPPADEEAAVPDRRFARGLALLRFGWPVVVAVLAGLVITGFVFHIADQDELHRIESSLVVRAELRAREFERAIEAAAFPVRAAATFVASQNFDEHDEAELEEFKRFVADARGTSTPIRSMIWAPRVDAGRRAVFEAEIRAEGQKDFAIVDRRTGTITDAAQRDDYYPVLIHIPFEKQASLVGFDIASDLIRGRAARLARDIGRPVGSLPVQLVTLTDKEPSYVVYFPIYWGGTVPDTLDTRRARIRGVVTGTFRVRAVLASALPHTEQIQSAIAFYMNAPREDGQPAESRQLVGVYSPIAHAIRPTFSPEDPGGAAAFEVEQSFDVLGQQWQLSFHYPLQLIDEERTVGPLAILLVGLLLTTVLAAYVGSERGKIIRIRNTVGERTAELRQLNFSLRQEIGKRQEATALVEAANTKLQALLDASPLPIVSLDTRCRVVTWNQAAERTFGYAATEVIRRPYPLVSESEREEFHSLFRQVANGEVLHDIAVRRRHRDGRFIEVVFSGAPLYNADRRLVGAVYVLEDVTEKRKLERQLAQAVKMDAVGQLTGGLAHDFNNILGVIVGNLDQQIEMLRANPAAGTRLEEVKLLGIEALDATLRGAELVQRLLAFSRSQPLQPRRIDIGKVVRDIEPLLGRSLGERISIDIRGLDGLWPVIADQTQLENVILNLAINARDAMPNGGKLTITGGNKALDEAAAEAVDLRQGDYVTITVGDTGTGIPPDILPRVIEPFFTTKEVGKGSGLGLSMVYGYARQSGGTVRIYSEVERGTDVRIYLPRSFAASEDRPASAAPVSPTPVGHERILVVEDKPEVRQMACRLIESLGYTVFEADCAAAAVAAFDDHQTFDLLFTDIVMPGEMSGIDLAQVARQRFPKMPIVFTSGFSNPETIQAEVRTLGAAIISKPYRKSELAACLRSVLDGAAPPVQTQ